MCNRTVQSFMSNVVAAADRMASNTAEVAQDSVESGDLPSVGAAASIVDAEVVDATAAAIQDAITLFTDDTNWGEAVRIDQGESPRHFGYGESKETIAELRAGPRWTSEAPDLMLELAAKLRTFGHEDPEGLSGSAGIETETGLHGQAEPGRWAGVDFGTQDAFLGVRGRAVAEAGCLGARAGQELFLGASFQGRAGDTEVGTADPWWFGAYSADLGVAEAAVAEVDVLSADLYAGARAGLDLRAKGRRHDPLFSGLGVVSKTDLSAFVGAAAEAAATLDVRGLSIEAEAFAGARAGLQQGFSGAWDGSEILGGFVAAEGWVGMGAEVEANIGYDPDEERYHLSGDAGAAIGVGASVGGGVSIAGKDLGHLFDVGDDD